MNEVTIYTETFSQDSWLVGRDLNWSPPKHKSKAMDWFTRSLWWNRN